MLNFIKKYIYLSIALVAIFWSVFNSLEDPVHERTEYVFAKKDYSFSTKQINEVKLKNLSRYRLKIEGKNRKSGMGTAFYIGHDLWLTARHVVDNCKRVLMQEASKKRFIEKILIHPNSDLALFKHENSSSTNKFKVAPQILKSSFTTGFPGGNPGDATLSLAGFMAMEERSYNILEKHTIFAVLKKNPKTLASFGGISGGPSFDNSGNLNGVIVTEFTRRGLLGAVGIEQIEWLMKTSEKGSYFSKDTNDKAENYVMINVSQESFESVGKKLRHLGTVNQLFCLA